MTKRNYEIVIIVNMDFYNDIESIINKYCKYIEENKGVINKIEKIGKKNLSYEIKKNNIGYYFIINIELNANLIHNIDKKIKNDENIIRYLIIKTKKNKI